MPRQPRREEYTVGWVCALPIELATAVAMLDEEYKDTVSSKDDNVYRMGSIAGHNVVIVLLPDTGTNMAATVATQMQASFEALRFRLMVGIGGGVPSAKADIRLGDVVVSVADGTLSGVVQYDLGKATQSGFQRTGYLNSPPQILRSAVRQVQTNMILDQSMLSRLVSMFKPRFQREKLGPDLLFDATYVHEEGSTCEQHSVDRRKTRPERDPGEEIEVHHGIIASGNLVIKDGIERDRISALLGGVLCFEMEAAGLMNSFPCLVIRGICDYADSHKTKHWQPHAAATAAAYAKELLSAIPVARLLETPQAREVTSRANAFGSQTTVTSQTDHDRKELVNLNGVQGDSTNTMTPPVTLQPRRPVGLSADEYSNLMKSLDFEQIDARQRSIRAAHSMTCQWLIRNEQYLGWLNSNDVEKHHGFLWIKAKAGAGKSTLMKFARDHARRTIEDSKSAVLSFFFNARGENLEKSTIGAYRSLLSQLLGRFSKLQSVFDCLGRSASRYTANYQWAIEPLKMVLERAVLSLDEESVICFIDALDECDEDQAWDMIQFFQHLGNLTVENNTRFQICFSSRHYPNITIRNALELDLKRQDGHTADITRYIQAELQIGESVAAQEVEIELQRKASGIFMWAVLVVGILNRSYARGRGHDLQKKLDEIPNDLNTLFHDIIMRDTENTGELLLCIQWQLFAARPLSPELLYLAIRVGTDHQAVRLLDLENVTKQDINLFLLDVSKGLIELTASDDPRVQFIHESVRDFLIKDNGLGTIIPSVASNLPGVSHEQLKHCCLDYINLITASLADSSSSQSTDGSSSPSNLSFSEAGDPYDIAMKDAPFLEYAVRNVLYHADQAAGHGISQTDFCMEFPIDDWMVYRNLLEQFDSNKHSEDVSLLYVLAELNMVNLIKAIPSVDQCMDVENARYGCAIFAAAATGSIEALEFCLESIGVDLPEYWAAQDFRRIYFEFTEEKSFWSCAVELNLGPLLPLLLEKAGSGIDAADQEGKTALWWAAEKGWESEARSVILSRPAMIDLSDRYGDRPLTAAVRGRHTAIVGALIEAGADVDWGHGIAIRTASSEGYTDIVDLLVQGGATVDAMAEPHGITALQQASANGNKDTVTLLLDNGADPNANINANTDAIGKDWLYRTALQAASYQGYTEIAMLLLERGADADGVGGGDRRYGTALQAAAYEGYKDLTMQLLHSGADVNAAGGEHGSALQAASYNGHRDIAILLLDRGADVNAKTKSGFCYALQAALWERRRGTVVVLLERGADLNVQGGRCDNVLVAALEAGHEDIKTLLVHHGFSTSHGSMEYGHAKMMAVPGCGEKIAAMLLNTEVLINPCWWRYGWEWLDEAWD